MCVTQLPTVFTPCCAISAKEHTIFFVSACPLSLITFSHPPRHCPCSVLLLLPPSTVLTSLDVLFGLIHTHSHTDTHPPFLFGGAFHPSFLPSLPLSLQLSIPAESHASEISDAGRQRAAPSAFHQTC